MGEINSQRCVLDIPKTTHDRQCINEVYTFYASPLVNQKKQFKSPKKKSMLVTYGFTNYFLAPLDLN